MWLFYLQTWPSYKCLEGQILHLHVFSEAVNYFLNENSTSLSQIVSTKTTKPTVSLQGLRKLQFSLIIATCFCKLHFGQELKVRAWWCPLCVPKIPQLLRRKCTSFLGTRRAEKLEQEGQRVKWRRSSLSLIRKLEPQINREGLILLNGNWDGVTWIGMQELEEARSQLVLEGAGVQFWD